MTTALAPTEADPTKDVHIAVALLLRRHGADSALSGVLTVIGPHVAQRPTGANPDIAALPVQVLAQLSALLVRHGGAVLVDLLHLVARHWRPAGRGGQPRRPRVEALTSREVQVLVGMSLGKGNAQIGRELHLAENTIKTHVSRMLPKLGARDRTHAVHIAHLAGILPVDGDR